MDSRDSDTKRKTEDYNKSSKYSDYSDSSKKSRTKEYYSEEKYYSSDFTSKHKQKSSSKYREADESRYSNREEKRSSEHLKSKSDKSSRKVDAAEVNEKCWLSSNLRVRIVDQQYKKGRHYNTKVR